MSDLRNNNTGGLPAATSQANTATGAASRGRPAATAPAAPPATASGDIHILGRDLSLRFGMRGLEVQRPGLAFLKVDAENAVALITHLQQLCGYTHLAFFTAIDQIEENEFDLLYMLHSYAANQDLGVTVRVPRENAVVDGIHHLWPAAATYQQELREMYGVRFPNSPRLDEDFALEGWQELPPMRRDFDTKEYSERTYYARPGRQTHETRAHMKEKLYPSEAETW